MKGSPSLIAPAGDLHASDESLEEYFVTLGEGLTDSSLQLGLRIHPRGSHTRPSGIGLSEEREPKVLYELMRRRLWHVLAQTYRVRYPQMREGGEVTIAVILTESQRLGQYAPRIVGHSDQIQVALQKPVLPWGTMHRDEGIIKAYPPRRAEEAKVILVHWDRLAPLLQMDVPALPLHND
jgi:hypothetical protein